MKIGFLEKLSEVGLESEFIVLCRIVSRMSPFQIPHYTEFPLGSLEPDDGGEMAPKKILP